MGPAPAPVSRGSVAAKAESMQRSRQMVFVSGAPGAGKTSLAVPLAAELGFALVCKDKLKETLHDALGAPAPDLAWSRKLGAAAMELLWALAADAPSVVIEANFRPHDPYQRRKLSALAQQPVEVTASAALVIPVTAAAGLRVGLCGCR